MTPNWIPDAGDVVWLDFDPQSGHEQAGRRPALVLSPRIYNSRTSLMICCPMTTRPKDYPFEVRVSDGYGNVVLADQVKSLDWRQRSAQFKSRITATELAHVRAKILALIGG